MKNGITFFRSFYVKVLLSFIFSLLFVALLGNFLLLRYSLKSQFTQLREKIKVIAQTAVLSLDVSGLESVPLSPAGVESDSFRELSSQLLRIKNANPLVKYIYIMKKTEEPGIYMFVVDLDAVSGGSPKLNATSFPGDRYNAGRFPEMLKAFDGPRADQRLVVDEWGKMLSGYAPIPGKDGFPVAILGIDIDASDVYAAERGLLRRGVFVLFTGIVFSLLLGSLVSSRIIVPIRKLIEGTRRIGAGDLNYRVDIRSHDEIGQLAASFNEMTLGLSEARKKLHDYFYRMVQAMIRSLEAKDPYTRGHSDRVSELSYDIALKMGVKQEDAEMLKKAAQMHDIGKLGMQDDILNKKSGLSQGEWDTVRKHPEVGEEILKPVFLDRRMLSVIRSHHERFDGTGYPDGLKDGQISIFAQIASVADAYDAMTSSRSYHAALGREEAVARIKAGSGTQFNPDVVRALLEVFGLT
ncbi:MAG: HD-GYP domain-containing protein [Candidatus Omnitrophica bacterium]|nr:HD-GYP domain-containing protein [Candidatus Omnitrophota bacterium]MDD5042417.1 HD-GYP domain-containing protein [Candidatus Omnitrophota bacterium]MDD5500820.1 HD-GYP domain-containing protein [Candidatus Omnitrophota bacterium]